MLDPPLMLLDEPFSALDPITRRNIQDEFVTLQRIEKRSVILVTHDMGGRGSWQKFLGIFAGCFTHLRAHENKGNFGWRPLVVKKKK